MVFSPEDAEMQLRKEAQQNAARRRLTTGEEPTAEEIEAFGDDHLPSAGHGDGQQKVQAGTVDGS